MRLHKRVLSGLAGATLALGIGASAAAGLQPVEAQNQPNLYGTDYSLQNYFNAFGELSPFFDVQSGRVGPAVEVPSHYIYDIDLGRRSITMNWNTDPEWDMFEPYVGALAGVSQEQAAALPIADEYWFTFDKPISDLTFVADPSMPLVPNTRIVDDHTLVISIPGGTTIGDGYDAVITIERGN